jgi:hypothetical protein
MRGSFVVVALALSPFVATVSRAQDPAPSNGDTRPMCQKDPGNPSASGEANRTKKCPPPVALGKVTISGTVFFDLAPYDGMFDSSNENGIAGWTVVLTGPSGQQTYNTATDPSNPGNYVFSGLPSGATYTVCVVPAMGWTQTGPSSGTQCPNGFGYSISTPALAVDIAFAGINFGYYSNPTSP